MEKPEKEPEPSGRKYPEPKKMPTEDLAEAFGLATRLRACEVSSQLDWNLKEWLGKALEELKDRKELESVREWLPVYYDSSRKAQLFGPGAAMTSLAALRQAIQPPARPVRAIAAS